MAYVKKTQRQCLRQCLCRDCDTLNVSLYFYILESILCYHSKWTILLNRHYNQWHFDKKTG